MQQQQELGREISREGDAAEKRVRWGDAAVARVREGDKAAARVRRGRYRVNSSLS